MIATKITMGKYLEEQVSQKDSLPEKTSVDT